MDKNISISVTTEVIACDGSSSRREILYEFGIKYQNASISGDFQLQITDPNDPGLLFDFKMTITDFATVKRDLSLRCDFAGFPDSLQKLLEFCTQKENWKAIIDAKSEDDPIFYIEETTDINLVRPMKLNIIKASDARLNEYLTGEVTKYKTLYLDNDKELKAYKSHMQITTEQAHTKNQELVQKYEDEITNLKSENQQLIQDSKIKIESLKAQCQAQLKTIEEQYKSKLEDQTQKISQQLNDLSQNKKQLELEKYQLISKNELLTEKIQNLESHNAEMKKEILKKEEDGKQYTSSLMDTSKKEAALQMQNELLKKDNSYLTTQISSLTKQVQEKDEVISSLKQKIAEMQNGLDHFNSLDSDYSKVLEENNFLKTKAKEVVTKLYDEINEYKQYCEEQDNKNQDLEDHLKEYQSREYQTNQQIIDYQSKQSELESQIRSLTIENKDLEKKLRNSQNEVNNLSRQLDQKALATLPSSFSTFSPMPNQSNTNNFGTPMQIKSFAGQYSPYIQANNKNPVYQTSYSVNDNINMTNDIQSDEYEEDAESDDEHLVDILADFRT